MKIRILFFAQWAEVFRERSSDMDVPDGSSAEDIARMLRAEVGNDKNDKIPCRYAVNQEFVDGNFILKDGDEFALISPVQGG